MLDFNCVKGRSLTNIEAVLNFYIPGGKWEGPEYVALNPTRQDNRLGSFKVNRHTGAWAEFATSGKGGGDQISCERAEAVICASGGSKMHDINEQIRAAMGQNGLSPADGIVIYADDHLHRYRVAGDKPNTRNGWYVLYPDGIPSGAFGIWKNGIPTITWSAKSQDQMTFAERKGQRHKIADACRQRDKVKAEEQQEAARRACDKWSAAGPADPQHPYLIKKRILLFMARQLGDELVLQIVDCKDKISSLQFIYSNGTKRLLGGGAKTSRFILVNRLTPNSQILICEGWATGVTLAQAYPNSSVIAAIDAGNLHHVAKIWRTHCPNAQIIIAGEIDGSGTGQREADKAAKLVNGSVVFPQITPEELESEIQPWINKDKFEDFKHNRNEFNIFHLNGG